jgi:glucose-1-phosphate thymidylyltransferase
MTLSLSKQLMPVYDKPMIYYPLTTLMLAGIWDILIITTPHDAPAFQHLLGDGAQWGLSLTYAVQPEPRVGAGYTIGADFVAGGPSCLVLGDNIFFATVYPIKCAGCVRHWMAQRSVYHVADPERYGVSNSMNTAAPFPSRKSPLRPNRTGR